MLLYRRKVDVIMKKILLALLLLVLTTGVLCSAHALTTEETYAATHDELLRYLSGTSLMTAEDLFAAFSSCGNYEHSASFVLYTKILADVEKGDFSLVYPLLQNLRVNTPFCEYTAATPGLGSIDELDAYTNARQAEQAGNINAAIVSYSSCMGFKDAASRYYALAGEQLEQQYQAALWHYQRNTPDGFEQAYSLLLPLAEKRYKDSEHYLSLVTLLRPSATPVPTPTNTPRPTYTPRITYTVTAPPQVQTVTQVRVLSGGAVLRSSARVGSHNDICSIRGGALLQVQDEENGWYLVTYNGQKGYVSASKVEKVSGSSGSYNSTVSQVRVLRGGTMLRSSARVGSHNDICSIREGVVLQVLGEENGWYRVSYNGQTGYVSANKVEKVY